MIKVVKALQCMRVPSLVFSQEYISAAICGILFSYRQYKKHNLQCIKMSCNQIMITSMILTLESSARLNNGVEIPYLGLGVSLPVITWQHNPTYCGVCVKDWIPAH